MHRHGVQPQGQRGNNLSALQVGKPAVPAITTPTSLARTPHLATAINPQYQSVVGQLAQSHRVLQPVAQTVSSRSFLFKYLRLKYIFVSPSSWEHHRPHRFKAHCFGNSPPHPPQALVPARHLTGLVQVKALYSEKLTCDFTKCLFFQVLKR